MNSQHSNTKNILDGFKYATSAVDLIRILEGNHDIDMQLRTFVRDMFVHTMELLWFHRYNPASAILPKMQFDMETKKLVQHFKIIRQMGLGSGWRIGGTWRRWKNPGPTQHVPRDRPGAFSKISRGQVMEWTSTNTMALSDF